MVDRCVRVSKLRGFDDPRLSPEQWNRLVARGDTRFVSLTWEAQSRWWATRGHGKRLLLFTAEVDGELVAVAPLYEDDGCVYFVGTGDSDYLDFVGDISALGVVEAFLRSAVTAVPGFREVCLYNVLDESRTGGLLATAGSEADLACSELGSFPAPMIDLVGQREWVLASTLKSSTLRNERLLQREGELVVRHTRVGVEILPHLDAFFEQHVARRALTPHPSRFLEEYERDRVRSWTREMGDTGWLRFTRIDWCDRPFAFHYGSCFSGRYYYGTPCFAIEQARWSPGILLLRHVLLDAIQEGARVFDFGLGDEPYKLRFATHVPSIHGWRLAPIGALTDGLPYITSGVAERSGCSTQARATQWTRRHGP